jgi:hypothetical protein
MTVRLMVSCSEDAGPPGPRDVERPLLNDQTKTIRMLPAKAASANGKFADMAIRFGVGP